MRWLLKYRRVLSLLVLGLFTAWQAQLHTASSWQHAHQLVNHLQEDWAAQKRRLFKLLGFGLLAACFALAALMLMGFMALLLSWHTDYFALTCLLVIGSYSLAALRCALHVLKLAKQSEVAFAASHQALTKSLASLRGT